MEVFIYRYVGGVLHRVAKLPTTTIRNPETKELETSRVDDGHQYVYLEVGEEGKVISAQLVEISEEAKEGKAKKVGKKKSPKEDEGGSGEGSDTQ